MPLQPHEKKAISFLLRHLAAGIGGAIALGGLLLWLDIGHMWTLIVRSDHPILYTFMLFFSLIITFGSVSVGIGVMNVSNDDESS